MAPLVDGAPLHSCPVGDLDDAYRVALDAGLHRTYWTTLERGMRNPSLETLCRVARALGCEVGDLVEGLQAEPGRPT